MVSTKFLSSKGNRKICYSCLAYVKSSKSRTETIFVANYVVQLRIKASKYYIFNSLEYMIMEVWLKFKIFEKVTSSLKILVR